MSDGWWICWSLMKISWYEHTIQHICHRGWRMFDPFWVQNIVVDGITPCHMSWHWWWWWLWLWWWWRWWLWVWSATSGLDGTCLKKWNAIVIPMNAFNMGVSWQVGEKTKKDNWHVNCLMELLPQQPANSHHGAYKPTLESNYGYACLHQSVYLGLTRTSAIHEWPLTNTEIAIEPAEPPAGRKLCG